MLQGCILVLPDIQRRPQSRPLARQRHRCGGPSAQLPRCCCHQSRLPKRSAKICAERRRIMSFLDVGWWREGGRSPSFSVLLLTHSLQLRFVYPNWDIFVQRVAKDACAALGANIPSSKVQYILQGLSLYEPGSS